MPGTVAMDVVEVELSTALDTKVGVGVGGTRPPVIRAQVLSYFIRFFQVEEREVRFRRYRFGGFLVTFDDDKVTDRVLHAAPAPGADFLLFFRRWQWQSGAQLKIFLLIFGQWRWYKLLSVLINT
jgi:hypothetical protein